MLSARKKLDIVTAYREVGTYRGAGYGGSDRNFRRLVA